MSDEDLSFPASVMGVVKMDSVVEERVKKCYQYCQRLHKNLDVIMGQFKKH